MASNGNIADVIKLKIKHHFPIYLCIDRLDINQRDYILSSFKQKTNRDYIVEKRILFIW
jgi:hypothetical protein